MKMTIDREHLANLLEWSFDEIFSYHGDGGANWVVKRYNIRHVHLFINTYLQERREANKSRLYKNRMIVASTRYEEWDVGDIKEGSQGVGQSFTVFRPSEQCLLVTTDETNIPPWNECIVIL